MAKYVDAIHDLASSRKALTSWADYRNSPSSFTQSTRFLPHSAVKGHGQILHNDHTGRHYTLHCGTMVKRAKRHCSRSGITIMQIKFRLSKPNGAVCRAALVAEQARSE